VIIYRIFIFAGNRAVEIRKYVSLKAAIIIGTLLLTVGGTILSIKMYPPLNKPMAKSNNQAEDKPNIMLITMDTTRADHLSCYGYHKNTSPHLDTLAQEAVRFENAYAPSPWTLPSHASLLTGIYPAQHGAHWDDESVKANWPAGLAEQYKTLTEILVDNDYKTAGVIGAPFCHSSFGLAQGFKYYDDALVNVIPDLEHFTLFKILSRWFLLMDIATKKGLNGCRIASQINKLVFSWLDKHSQDPFFLFIHYYDPHAPYLPPDGYSLLFREDENTEITESERHKRYLLSQYDGEIAYLDYHLGKIFEKLKELKIYDSTMIIITSDHGEFFGEHECWTHGYELYQEVLKVPLIIKYPSNYVKTGVYQERVSLVDIMPTILYVLGLPIPKEVQGAALCEGESKVMAEVYRHAYRSIPEWELKFARDLQSLYLGNYKYIKDMNGQGELYDIVNDPRELRNLINIMPEEAEKMELKLTEWLPHVESHLPNKEVKLDKATEETLRALGYLQ